MLSFMYKWHICQKKVQESKEARIRDQEEMKKNQSDMEAKLKLVLNQFQPS
jgi:hypothetical protein